LAARLKFARGDNDFESHAVAMGMLQERRKTAELRLRLFTFRPKFYEPTLVIDGSAGQNNPSLSAEK